MCPGWTRSKTPLVKTTRRRRTALVLGPCGGGGERENRRGHRRRPSEPWGQFHAAARTPTGAADDRCRRPSCATSRETCRAGGGSRTDSRRACAPRRRACTCLRQVECVDRRSRRRLRRQSAAARAPRVRCSSRRQQTPSALKSPNAEHEIRDRLLRTHAQAQRSASTGVKDVARLSAIAKQRDVDNLDLARSPPALGGEEHVVRRGVGRHFDRSSGLAAAGSAAGCATESRARASSAASCASSPFSTAVM